MLNKYQVKSGRLFVNGDQVNLPADAKDVIELENNFLVLLEKGANNIYLLDNSGKIIWQIKQMSDLNENNYFLDIWFDKDGRIIVRNSKGGEYLLNLKTGVATLTNNGRPW